MFYASSRFAYRLAATLVAVASLSSVHARVWTSSDGRPLAAEFVALQGENVLLKIAGGRTIPVPLARLS